MTRYICLKCFHIWDARKEEVMERRCFRCKTTAIVDLEKYNETVRQIKKALTPSGRPLMRTLDGLEAFTSFREITKFRLEPVSTINLLRKMIEDSTKL